MNQKLEVFTSLILKIINEYCLFCEKILNREDKESQYPCITEIEHLYNVLFGNINTIDTDLLGDIIDNLDESALIKATRLHYKQLGVNLKTNWRSPITIQTERRKITFHRYMLSPMSAEDKVRLLELEKVKNIYPIDRVLGLSNLPFKMTVEAMLKVSNFGQEMRSYKKASEILLETNGIKLDPATIVSVTNHIGEIAFNNEYKNAIETFDLLERGKLQFPTKKKDSTLFIQVDGAMVNTRKCETDSTWHVNKLGLVYSSDNVKVTGKVLRSDGTREERHKILIKEYTAYIGEVSEFKKLLFSCALRNGYGAYKETVLVSDGATWIRNMKEQLFPDALQILDFFHVSEKIWDFGKLYFNLNTKLYTPWCEKICHKLRNSEYRSVIDEIKTMERKIDKNKATVSNYLLNNIDNIDYLAYQKKGFIIGSGAIESSNKTVLQYRLKQPGMRWNIKSAQNVVTLRAKKESNLWFKDVVIPVKNFYNVTCF
jgi:hypothetical protein